ncbi:hypothetical protein DPX16_21856 [Anabarilius grahami]|uniref:Uncharacterized protein n=1 Tax=Anabarilius grahami TaxID=495550 RepID=A0A3N0YBR8_ANAGA|nr:hypothetical protein DPX16_21856 [Anabarilius grahami]
MSGKISDEVKREHIVYLRYMKDMAIWNKASEDELIIMSDGTNSDTWTGTHEDPSFSEADLRSSTPLAESTICGTESTAMRKDHLQSSNIKPKPPGKRRKMQDESSSEESTNLMSLLASQENTNDAISAYCKNLENRMRNLPPHLLPHFQHDVDNCIFKYSVGHNHASSNQYTHL